MKCPKCSYLGFERVDRCRNCGYDFSLSNQVPAPDFAIRRDTETSNRLEDLSLIDSASEWKPERPMMDVAVDLDRMFGETVSTSAAAPAPAPASARAATSM